MFKSIFTSWWTSAAGTIAGLPQIIEGLSSKPVNWTLVITGVATFLFGLAAKDGNVTGGNVR